MAQSLFLEKDSPVEFLYLDRRRIASLIGQLSDNGMLVGLKSTSQKQRGQEGNATGNIGIAKGEVKRSGSSSASSEETYDPFWAHAFSFLQDLEANFAVPLADGRIGSLVKFKSYIQIIDLKLMRNLWEPIGRAVSSASAQPIASLSRKQKKEQRLTPEQQLSQLTMKLGIDVLKEAPHLLHLTFLAAESPIKLWAVGDPDYLTISSDALSMKFGVAISGCWTVVGIMDAGVGEQPEPWGVNSLIDGVTTAICGLREVIGRPKDFYGLTPIAIYSPITGIAECEAAKAANPSDGPLETDSA
jgi:hypothetical protein